MIHYGVYPVRGALNKQEIQTVMQMHFLSNILREDNSRPRGEIFPIHGLAAWAMHRDLSVELLYERLCGEQTRGGLETARESRG